MRFLPHTDAERAAMLATIGVADIGALFAAVPERARLKAPIGLRIGARSPWQIAVSVVAEAIQALQAADAQRVWPAAFEPV